MKVALLRVAIDSGSGGCQGPLFRDGSFEYVPIPDNTRKDPRTYGNTRGRHGRQLADYLPSSIRWRLSQQSMHVDPEFETFTYGDPTPPKAGLRFLEAGDLLVFYAGLEGWDFHSPPALYIIGYFDVSRAGIASQFKPSEVRSVFGRNAHVRNRRVYEEEKDRLVLVKGSSDSRLLAKAVWHKRDGTGSGGQAPQGAFKRDAKNVWRLRRTHQHPAEPYPLGFGLLHSKGGSVREVFGMRLGRQPQYRRVIDTSVPAIELVRASTSQRSVRLAETGKAAMFAVIDRRKAGANRR